MKIGIDARFYGEAGPGRYAKNIVQHLEKVDRTNEYIIFLREDGFSSYEPENPNFTRVLADYPWYSFDEQIRFLFKVLGQKLDLFYVPHFNIPILYPKKLVTAIPDLIMHTYSTEKGTALPKPYFKFKKLVYKLVFWWAVARSIKVIVPTKTVMNDFLRVFPKISKSKYVIAPEGVDPDYLDKNVDPQKVMRKYGISKPFLLHVGSMYEHKNIEGLIEMFEVLIDKYNYEGQLVFVSKKDKFSEEIFNRVSSEGLSGRIIMPAFVNPNQEEDVVVSDLEVVALRTQADVYVMAAFKEGFSLTALEGMAIGLPAVISDIPCHREVYGDSVEFFDPHNPEDMAGKINNVLSDSDFRDELVEKGVKQVEKYDWKETAKITLGVFNKALKK